MLGRVAKAAFVNNILWSAFTSMSMRQYVDESRGSKIGTPQEPPATSRPSLRGPYPTDVDALGWAKTLWAVQILPLRMPLACGRRYLGGSEPPHRAPQVSQSLWGCQHDSIDHFCFWWIWQPCLVNMNIPLNMATLMQFSQILRYGAVGCASKLRPKIWFAESYKSQSSCICRWRYGHVLWSLGIIWHCAARWRLARHTRSGEGEEKDFCRYPLAIWVVLKHLHQKSKIGKSRVCYMECKMLGLE